LSVRADFFARPQAELLDSAAAGCGQPPLPLKYVRILSKTFTILEIEEAVGAALAAPASADSAAKGKSRVADRRSKEKERRKTQKLAFLERKTRADAHLKNFQENKHDQIYCLLPKIHR
jgi:hypothetical protein